MPLSPKAQYIEERTKLLRKNGGNENALEIQDLDIAYMEGMQAGGYGQQYDTSAQTAQGRMAKPTSPLSDSEKAESQALYEQLRKEQDTGIAYELLDAAANYTEDE